MTGAYVPAIKARLAGGYCLRAPAQGSCPYANICEHCPNFRTDAASVSVLSAQRRDAEALVADAESAVGSTRPSATGASSPASTPSWLKVRIWRDDSPRDPGQSRADVR